MVEKVINEQTDGNNKDKKEVKNNLYKIPMWVWGVIIVFVIIMPLLINKILSINNPFGIEVSGDTKDWISFFGNYIGSIIGVGVSLFILYKTLRQNYENHQELMKYQINSTRYVQEKTNYNDYYNKINEITDFVSIWSFYFDINNKNIGKEVNIESNKLSQIETYIEVYFNSSHNLSEYETKFAQEINKFMSTIKNHMSLKALIVTFYVKFKEEDANNYLKRVFNGDKYLLSDYEKEAIRNSKNLKSNIEILILERFNHNFDLINGIKKNISLSANSLLIEKKKEIDNLLRIK